MSDGPDRFYDWAQTTANNHLVINPSRTDPRINRVLDRLNRLVSPGAAQFFGDACRLMALNDGASSPNDRRAGAVVERPFLATTHLVGHLVREIESALREVIVTKRTPKSKSKSGHAGSIDAVFEALEIEGNDLQREWQLLADDLAKTAHRDALSTPRPSDREFRTFWNRAVSVFDFVLDHFEPKFQIAYQRVEELRAFPDGKRLANEIPRNPMLFERLFREPFAPQWVTILKEERFFERTPEAVLPAMRFVSAVAETRPEMARKIATCVRSIDNPFVLAEYLDLLNRLPKGGLPKRLVGVVLKWIDAHPRFGNIEQSLFAKFTAIIKRLASENRLDEARRLFKRFLSTSGPRRGADKSATIIDPSMRLDAWHFNEILRQTSPTLAGKDPLGTMTIMCDALSAVASLQTMRSRPREDFSYYWRDHIGINGPLPIPRHRDSLLNAIRDAALSEVRRRPAALDEIIDLFLARKKRLFDRLVFWLLTQTIETARARRLGTKLILDARRFRRPRPDVEESDLLRALYPRLGVSARRKVRAIIDAGPKIAHRRRTIDPESEARLNGIWRRDRLASIREWLDARHETEFAALVESLGEPPTQNEARPTAGAFGSTSPKTAEDLAALEPDELSRLLRTWEPGPKDLFAPSIAGLGDALKTAVGDAPDRYVNQLGVLTDVDPTYARSIVAGFLAALRAGRPLAWRPILEYCGWVVAQPRDPAENKSDLHFDRDGSWRWSRCEAIELLTVGLDAAVSPIPGDLLDLAWSVAEPITRDPDPAFDGSDEAEGDGPTGVAINSTRGRALHFAFRYLARRRRDFGTPDNRLGFTMSLLPRVQAVFEERLDEQAERSPAVRSVYGFWFSHVLSIDPAWATCHVTAIFGRPGSSDACASAAWGAFLRYGGRSHATFESLREHYIARVSNVGQSSFDSTRAESSDDAALGEHLASYYWNSVIEIDGDDKLLVRFYASAPDELRAHVSDFLGRSFNSPDIAQTTVQRMRAFWDWRAQETRSTGGSSAELASFAWWYGSGKFDEDWASAKLVDAVERAGALDPEFAVLSRLASIARDDPASALACLDTVVRFVQNPWAFLGSQEDIRAIIQAGRADPTTSALAAGIASRLAAKGLKAFEELL